MNGSEVGTGKHGRCKEVAVSGGSTVFAKCNIEHHFEKAQEAGTLRKQEPITRSIQLPYSVCQTAFSQVELFLDIIAFTQISSQ